MANPLGCITGYPETCFGIAVPMLFAPKNLPTKRRFLCDFDVLERRSMSLYVFKNLLRRDCHGNKVDEQYSYIGHIGQVLKSFGGQERRKKKWATDESRLSPIHVKHDRIQSWGEGYSSASYAATIEGRCDASVMSGLDLP